MVKGVSKQVILVKSPDPEIFEQAIFILNENAVKNDGVSDDDLMKEARAILRSRGKKPKNPYYGPVWACAGAMIVGAIWLITYLI